MFTENNQLSVQQFRRMFLIEIFGTFSLTMPAILTRGAEYQGLWALLLGSVVAGIYLCFLLKVRITIKGDYGSCLSKGFGKTGMMVVAGLYWLRFAIKSAYTMLLFESLIKANLLKSQNRFLIFIPFFILCGYVAYQGMETRGRVLEILFFVIFVPLLFVLLLSIPELSLGQMLPKGKIQITPFLKTGYLVFLSYSCMEFLLFNGGGFVKKDRIENAAKKSFVLAVGLHILLFLVTIGLFGVQLSKDTLWPALAIMETAKLPADFISRLDILLIAFWIFSMFGVVSGYETYSMWLAKDIFPKEQKGIALIIFLTVSGVIALLLPDIETSTIWFVKYMAWVDFPVAIMIPAFLWWKEKRKKDVR